MRTCVRIAMLAMKIGQGLLKAAKVGPPSTRPPSRFALLVTFASMRSAPGRVLLATMLLCASAVARANDGAAAIAAGGVVLRDERRVSMRKERLAIRLLGEDKANITRFRVSVEYEFANETSEDVTTEVAFPVPEYKYSPVGLEGPLDLGGFRAWIDGREIPVQKQVRAIVGGQDQAATLGGLGIDVEHFGYFDPDSSWSQPGHPDQLRRLAPVDAERLLHLGLIEGADPDNRLPQWTVTTTWHWTQRFPAGTVVRVRHEYTPAAGFVYSGATRELLAGLPRACADDALVKGLEAQKARVAEAARSANHEDHSTVFAAWVQYILKTANTWKTPIRDFELLVERPEGRAVSFCWDGRVEKVSKTTFSAKATDFVPTSDLVVYFFTVT